MKIKAGIILLVFLLALEGCVMQNSHQNETTPPAVTTTQAPPSVDGFVPNFTYQSAKANQYSHWLSAGTFEADYLRLINKNANDFAASYPPTTLMSLNTAATNFGKAVEVDARVAYALYAMLDEMRCDGITDVRITSGYRSYEYQEILYNNYKNKEMTTISYEAYSFFGAAYIQEHYTDLGIERLTEEDAAKVANFYSAQPGKSEHHTGLAVDLIIDGWTELSEDFEDTAAFAWLEQNAYRFGFILRYSKGKSNITGYIYEPWHYRYVGREAAAEIYAKGLTLEEYLGRV